MRLGGAKARLLALMLIILLLLPSVFAGICGGITLGSGTCSGNAMLAPNPVTCSGIIDQNCCMLAGCGWNGACYFNIGGTLPNIKCQDYDDNQLACETAGCGWCKKGGIPSGNPCTPAPVAGICCGTDVCNSVDAICEACKNNGETPCSEDYDCCSGFACDKNSKTCVPPCLQQYDSCGIATMPCCSGLVCNLAYGKCDVCKAEGDGPCIGNLECCSGLVCDTGSQTCIQPCVQQGGSCDNGETCCGGLVCYNDPNSAGPKTCELPCSPETASCSVDGDCCGGLVCNGQANNPLVKECEQVNCIVEGDSGCEPATSASGCCAGLECFAQGGMNTCRARCSHDNGACTIDSDCCSKNCKTSLRCGCEPDGNSCNANNDCCNKFCNSQKKCGCDSIGAVCASDSDCCSGICDCAGHCSAAAAQDSWNNDIYTWVALAIMISATFIALAYMAAKILELQVLEAWVKVEISELATGIVIALFCIVLIASTNTAARFLSGACDNADIVSAANGFIRNEWYDDGRALYLALANAYFNIAKISSYSYTAGLSLGIASYSYSETPGGGLSALVAQVGQGMDSVANFMLLAAAQSSFLLFFKGAAVIMLPVGIFLRTFSLTRKIGGVVLAAVIASAVIYPVATLLSKEIYQNFRPDLQADTKAVYEVQSPPNPPSASTVCSPYMQFFVQSPIPFIGGETGWKLLICSWLGPLAEVCNQIINVAFFIVKALFPIIEFYGVLEPYVSDMATTSDLMDGYYQPIADHALPAVSKYAVLSLVNFLTPLIITIVLLRNLAITFGGEPQLYGLSKLV